MNFDHKPHRGDKLQPLDEISGYKVRPGFYDRDGAAQAANGVSFTIHSMGATGCTLLLFRPKEQEPFAKIRYPETYCIGSTYSMLVFGLNIEDFEYAFQLNGPYDEKKGLRFHKDNILLDPYARAVTGQRHWGERPEGGKDFVYHARVVENNFDWEKSRFLNHPHFHFVEGDISIHSEWIEYHVKKCDVVLPLVAIATPIEYTRNPLRVFELDFEENLRIIRYCVKYRKRIIFPSTSEVYGMCSDKYFDEDHSNLIVGPVNKPRWIYSVSKQLLDRVIWAYGEKEGLQFTLFRPFNWMGPRLDNLNAARIGSSRAITQLILNLVEGSPIKLIDGGKQKRCFTDIRDGIEALYRIIENAGNRCDGEIINIGNPENEASIEELGEMLLASFEKHPLRHHFPPFAGFRVVESSSYYGKGYQDVEHRKPSIRNAHRCLDWEPKIDMQETIDETLDFFLRTVDLTDKPS